MHQGAHIRKGSKPRVRMNRTAVLFMAIIMLIGAVVGSTVAYLITKTGSVENQFTYAGVSCEVTEKFENNTKEHVQVKNTGSTDAYIRATYVVNWLDADGNIVTSVPDGYRYELYELTENPDNKWTKGDDGYFYYLSPVAPDKSTLGSLLTCTVTYPENPEYTLSVEILATAIQSTPAKAVKEAWGVDPETLSQGGAGK